MHYAGKAFNIKFGDQRRNRRGIYQVRQTLALLFYISCSNFRLILCVKDLTITKIVKKNNIGGAWEELQARKCLQRQSFTKYLRQILVFM